MPRTSTIGFRREGYFNGIADGPSLALNAPHHRARTIADLIAWADAIKGAKWLIVSRCIDQYPYQVEHRTYILMDGVWALQKRLTECEACFTKGPVECFQSQILCDACVAAEKVGALYVGEDA